MSSKTDLTKLIDKMCQYEDCRLLLSDATMLNDSMQLNKLKAGAENFENTITNGLFIKSLVFECSFEIANKCLES